VLFYYFISFNSRVVWFLGSLFNVVAALADKADVSLWYLGLAIIIPVFTSTGDTKSILVHMRN
jgi:hypothetical protein